MSISVDDLVSSLSSSHIGQEALDLAALQAQLTQTLFAQSFPSSSSSGTDSWRDPALQRCNTPTGRTPSSSFSWGHVIDAQRLSRRNTDEMLDDAEDERMVEDILIPPSSPMSAGVSASHSSFALQQQLTSAPRSQSKSSNRFSSPAATPSSFGPESSSFTSTDPFYLAQLQAMQSHNTSPPSVFSQIGRPTQQSPFLQRRDNLGLGFSSSAISLDTHNMFAATSR